MIEADKRNAIFLLHQEGMSARQVARRLGIARNSVRDIIAQHGQMPQGIRKDKQVIDPQLLRTLHEQCQGRVQRVYEKLTEEGRHQGDLLHPESDVARVGHQQSAKDPLPPGAR